MMPESVFEACMAAVRGCSHISDLASMSRCVVYTCMAATGLHGTIHVTLKARYSISYTGTTSTKRCDIYKIYVFKI